VHGRVEFAGRAAPSAAEISAINVQLTPDFAPGSSVDLVLPAARCQALIG